MMQKLIKRVRPLVLLALLIGIAPLANAQDNKLTKADLEAFALLVDRHFRTAETDTENIVLDRRIRLNNPLGNGIWFYAQLNTGQDLKLYRQRLNQLTLSADGNAIIQTSYVLKEPQKFVDTWTKAELLNDLNSEDYKPFFENGCEQVWKKTAGGSWYGRVNPDSCTIQSKRRNKQIRIESEGLLSTEQYQTNERGFEMDGTFLWGTKPGEYISLIPETRLSDLLTGVFSNEEQVYFEKDAGRQAPPWLSVRIGGEQGQMQIEGIDAFGDQVVPTKSVSVNERGDNATLKVGACSRFFEKDADGWKYSARQNRMACQQPYQIIHISSDALKLRTADGIETTLKRARPVTCWAAVPKKKRKEDGSIDWLFARQLEMHDQGGRVSVGGGDTGAEQVTLRMRAVHWPPPSRNRPSMVLYIHKEDPDRAASYSWADIDASRVGINLRWMQASCTIEGAERASDVNQSSFRG